MTQRHIVTLIMRFEYSATRLNIVFHTAQSAMQYADVMRKFPMRKHVDPRTGQQYTAENVRIVSAG